MERDGGGHEWGWRLDRTLKLVVVVVVVAMRVKGNQLAEVEWTLGRYDGGPNGVSQSVSIPEEANNQSKLIVEVRGRGRNAPRKLPDEFTADINDSQRVTIPADFIRENELKSGHRVRLLFYECVEQNFQTDDPQFEFVGESQVVGDASISDGCDARLTCSGVSDAYDGEHRTKLVNERNGKSVETVMYPSNADGDENRLCGFDLSTRRKLDAEIGDRITIYRDMEQTESNNEPEEKDLQQKVDELYQMVSEIHKMATYE